ncbi:MAG: NADH-quinone oxidoreductase subunit J [Candidatus Bathyarchaeota archaeon]|nr:NADH-quinone oxidoreductase subunit J [Candidatus Bathyarchaeota archaeon]
MIFDVTIIFDILAVGLIISAVLALFLDEVVYSVAALSGTFLFTALIYFLNGAIYAAIFQFVVGVGTLAVLFLSGEMLGEKPTKKASPTRVGGLVGAGFALSLPAIFLSVSGSPAAGADVSFGDALWNLRGVDVLLQAIVILTVAVGIAIVLYEKRKGAK